MEWAVIIKTVISCLIQVECAKVSSINEKSDWKTVRKDLSVIEFSESNIEVSPNLSIRSYNLS